MVRLLGGIVRSLGSLAFYAAPLGRCHLLTAWRYVDLKPLRAGWVERAVDHRWSSAGAHLTGQHAGGLLDMAGWAESCPRKS